MKPILFAATVFVVGTVSLTGQSASTDWPQWRGPDRNGLSKETGLLPQWPRSGPPVVWSAAMLGAGYRACATDRVLSRRSIVPTAS
jgi:hypothetical protein